MHSYDGGGRESLEDAGLEHCNVVEVFELCCLFKQDAAYDAA